MTQEGLLHLIAESGYNIGYAAKKHLATFDVVEKMPGWVSLISFIGGLLALYIPEFEHKHFAATFLVIGVASLYITFYQNDKDKYAKAGTDLTRKFHELRVLYQQVKALRPTDDLTPFVQEHNKIQTETLSLGISKQVFLSDWYAHYKFFWQMQISWIDESLHFRFWRDKMPLGATVLLICAAGGAAIYGLLHCLTYFQNFCK